MFLYVCLLCYLPQCEVAHSLNSPFLSTSQINTISIPKEPLFRQALDFQCTHANTCPWTDFDNIFSHLSSLIPC